MRIITICFLVLVSSAALASDRTEKIRLLMQAQGLSQMFEQQIQFGKIEARKQSKQVLDQLMTQLNPNKEFDARFRSASEEYIKSLETPWSTKDIVDVWANSYGARFTDQELDSLLAYYTSPLGKKDVLATQQALPEFSNHFSALSKPILDRATKEYIQRIQLIAKECKCKK